MQPAKVLDRERLIAFTQRLVQTPSLSLEEEAIARLVEDEMRALGYDQVRRDAMGNVLGIIEGRGDGPRLLFNGHIDHAGVGQMSEPFAGRIIEGQAFGHAGPVIYGRGAVDMKGGVAAMVAAGGMIKRLGAKLKGQVLVTAVAREEMARGEGIKALLDAGLSADFAVSGEATGNQVFLGHRGKFECRITTLGRTSHGGFPQGGVNAIFKMNQVLAALQTNYPLPSHPFLGQATVTALDISASPGALTPIVPDRCELVVDRRFLPEETQESLLAGFRELLGDLGREDPEFRAQVEPLKWFPSLYTPPESPIAQALATARAQVLGEPGPWGAWYFGVDGTFISQAGIPCVGLGPGDMYLAHTPRDVVPVSELEQAALIYAQLILDLCS
ncbi:MAG: M20/M25/M40 family metallo-hydrolase [Pseudomonadota bacterium]